MKKENKYKNINELKNELSGFSIAEIENALLYYAKLKYGLKSIHELNPSDAESRCLGVFKKYEFIPSTEMVINLFEVIIDDDEKGKHGVVFTPKYISDYMAKSCLYDISELSNDVKIIDPSCGCGAILISVVDYLHNRFDVPISQIVSHNIYGLDIMNDSVRQCKIVLMIYGFINGVDIAESQINIVQANSLECDWGILFNNGGFDYVIGNPPYVNSRDIHSDDLLRMKTLFETMSGGSPNLFYAFLEKSTTQIKADGKISFIIPNNFLTIKSALSLRRYLKRNKYLYSIVDFKSNLVFDPISTYSCIIEMTNRDNINVNHCSIGVTRDIARAVKSIAFEVTDIDNLNDDKWIFVDEQTRENILRIESQKHDLSHFIRTGIATLGDDLFFVSKDENGFYVIKSDIRYPIEECMVRGIIKVPRLIREEPYKNYIQYIIFPYVESGGSVSVIPEADLLKNFPLTYNYFSSIKNLLIKRDGGKGNRAGWYAYGRSQGINKRESKIVYPIYANKPNFTYIDDDDVLLVNGYAIYQPDFMEMDSLLKVLNSFIMDYYMRNTSTAISGGYFCYQKSYVRKFSIPVFNDEELSVLRIGTKTQIESMLILKYGLVI